MTFAPAAGFTPMQSFTDIRPRRASENRRSIYRRAVFTLLCSMTGISSDIEALAQPLATCWAVHVVERGDTLFEVAERAYGNGWLYRQIFEANRDLLPDERSIEVGDQLLIPCLDGTGPGTRAEAIELGLIRPRARQDDSQSGEVTEQPTRRPVPASEPPGQGGAPPAGGPGDASCAGVYTVSRGDTLFEVAERAYGNGWLYRQIFEANRDLLPDQRSIEVGDQLLIPCLDGTGPGTRPEAIELGLIERPAQETDPMEEPSQQAAPDVPRIVGDEPTHLECSYEGRCNTAAPDETLACDDASGLTGSLTLKIDLEAGIVALSNFQYSDPVSIEDAISILDDKINYTWWTQDYESPSGHLSQSMNEIIIDRSSGAFNFSALTMLAQPGRVDSREVFVWGNCEPSSGAAVDSVKIE